MGRKMRIKLGNTEVDVLELDFEVVREEWNEYRLLDGGRVRIKAIPQKIFRALDAEGKPSFTPEGDPNIIVRNSLNIVTSV